MSARLHLASSSPRRNEILRNLGLTFSCQGVDIDESRKPGETAASMVIRLAVEKAAAAAVDDDVMVLGADTAVVLGDQVLGKPHDPEQALAMLMQLSGQHHRVLTGVALRTSSGTQTKLSATDVHFREIERDEAVRYWHSGEPADKAGGYGIQGIGGAFVVSITGSYSGVVGLPVFETVELLWHAGIDVLRANTDRL